MKIIILIVMSFFFFGCAVVYPVGDIPMKDGSTVTYVTSSVGTPLLGPKVRVLDRYQYDPKTDKSTLIRSDSASTGEIRLDPSSLKGLVPVIP
jgi:hypothetical protein